MNDYWNNLEQCAGAGYAGFWFAVAILSVSTALFVCWLIGGLYKWVRYTDWYQKRQAARYNTPKKYHPKWENFKQTMSNVFQKTFIGLVCLVGVMIGLYIIYGSYTTIACMIEIARLK